MSSNGHSRSRLKGLDLQGYKTFASKSMFEFAPTITAIVGPNGSGKSNIADAIRWVLGEQSYSLLRGKRTDDMIFSGSEQRARASMAAATITFDNSDGWLPIDFSEVTVGRRAYRDGENEYLINGQRVRLREVAELLARCGLGERTYTIIGQGLVDAALSLKAEERRRLFEEAAGIGLYRSRREETLRRLDQTQRNLDRVQDILAELRPRLRSLERQARRAQDYEQVRGDLHAALRAWYGYHWYRLTDILGKARDVAVAEGASRDSVRAREEQADRQLTEGRLLIDKLRASLHRNAQQVSGAYREREALGRKLAVAEERLRWLGEQSAGLESEMEEIESSLVGLEGRLAAAQAEVEERRLAFERAEMERQALTAPGEPVSLNATRGSTLESLAAQRAASAARLEALELQAQDQRAVVDRLRGEIEAAEAKTADLGRQVHATSAEAEKLEASKGEAAHKVEETRRRQAKLETRLEGLSTEAVKRRTRLATLEARHALLQEMTQTAAALASRLAEGAKRGRYRWEGRLSSALQVDQAHRRAIAAALGPFAEAFGMPTAKDIDEVLQALAEVEDEGQAALIRLDSEPPSRRTESLDDPDMVGLAADLVQPAAPYRRAVDALLGRTLVVRNRAAAVRLAERASIDELRIVTLQGDIFLPGGHVLLGEGRLDRGARKESLETVEAELTIARRAAESAEGERTSVEVELHTTRQESAIATSGLEQLSLQYVEAKGRQAEATAASQAAVGHLEFLRGRLESGVSEQGDLADRVATERLRKADVDDAYARLGLETKRADLSAGSDAGAVHLAQADANLQLARSALEEARGRASELGAARAERESVHKVRLSRKEAMALDQARLQAEIDASRKEMEAIEARLTALAAEAAPAEAELAQTEQARANLEQEETRLRGELQGAERTHAQAQIELARREEELSSLQRRVEDDFGLVAFDFDENVTVQDALPIEGLVEHLTRIEELPPELEGQVNRLRLQLRRMGAINPEAQREYLEVKERVEFLGAQLGDLRKAETQLQSVIGELDELMEREFQKTFEAVGVEFRRAFTRLFGGGSVRLSLTDPDDLTTTGIDIEARLPGRREQGLPMLSGGERSLTACALVFALLKVSPTPFCVLDEVDAMLDESNVARFREMLHELAAETQFIVITHNRQTVQAADVIYGVSMGPDSASRVISLRLDEAEREMAA